MNKRESSIVRRSVLLCMLCAGLVTGSSASAQMQIPNPLIEPPKMKNPAAGPGVASGSSSVDNAARPGATDPFSTSGGAVLQQNDSVREVRERFASFYVSAIMGKQAVLRRNSGSSAFAMNASAGTGNSTSSGFGTSSGNSTANAAQPALQILQSSGRSETMVIADGEPIDFIGESITLMPKVVGNRVFVYYINADGKSNGKSGRHPVVFLGEVEAAEQFSVPAINIEKPDSAYKQSISVDTKSRSTSSTSGNSSSSPNAPSLPLN